MKGQGFAPNSLAANGSNQPWGGQQNNPFSMFAGKTGLIPGALDGLGTAMNGMHMQFAPSQPSPMQSWQGWGAQSPMFQSPFMNQGYQAPQPQLNRPMSPMPVTPQAISAPAPQPNPNALAQALTNGGESNMSWWDNFRQ